MCCIFFLLLFWYLPLHRVLSSIHIAHEAAQDIVGGCIGEHAAERTYREEQDTRIASDQCPGMFVAILWPEHDFNQFFIERFLSALRQLFCYRAQLTFDPAALDHRVLSGTLALNGQINTAQS